MVSHGRVGIGSAGQARPVWAEYGATRYGVFRQAGVGPAGSGWARQARRVPVRHGAVWSGSA